MSDPFEQERDDYLTSWRETLWALCDERNARLSAEQERNEWRRKYEASQFTVALLIKGKEAAEQRLSEAERVLRRIAAGRYSDDTYEASATGIANAALEGKP